MTQPDDFDALVKFVMGRYDASAERAATIVANHADAIRAEMEQAKIPAPSGSNRRVEDRPAREETPAEEKVREAAEQAEEDAEDVQPHEKETAPAKNSATKAKKSNTPA